MPASRNTPPDDGRVEIDKNLVENSIRPTALDRKNWLLIAAALTLWKQEQGAVDLLFTDLVMPGGMSGRELADQLLKEKPDLKVIHTSGYSCDIVPHQLRENTDGSFLQKPYAMQGLVQAVRSRLDER